MSPLAAKTHILSESQEKLWKEFRDLPKNWILFGNTALCLQLGHRESPDFRFKTAEPFESDKLREEVPFLRDAKVLENQPNYLKVAVGEVEMIFEGGETIKQVRPVTRAHDNNLAIASVEDLAGEKMYRISFRITESDCLDVTALIKKREIPVEKMTAFAQTQYGKGFDAKEALKNLNDATDDPNMHLNPEQATLLRTGAIQAQGLPRGPTVTPFAEHLCTDTKAVAYHGERPSVNEKLNRHKVKGRTS